MGPMRTNPPFDPVRRAFRHRLLIAAAILAATAAGGCGGGEEASPADAAPPREPAPEAVSTGDSDGEIGPGAGGVGAMSAASAGGGEGPGGSAGQGPGRSSAASPPPRSSASSSASASRPMPPAPTPKESVEQVYGEQASSLSRESQDGRFGDFRELMARNSSMMVEVAKARAAMRRNEAGAEAEYLELNTAYAKLADAIAAYMAESRWNARDREVMGYLYSRSNEEAVRRLQGGS